MARSSNVQQDLFTLTDAEQPAPEPVLMSLNPAYYELIWAAEKHFEYRRRYLHGPTQWFTWLTSPEARLGSVIDLGQPVIAAPAEIAELAERSRPGNGASVYEYTQDLQVAYAVPIVRIREVDGPNLRELRARLGRFSPPQNYIRVRHNPALLRLCRELLTLPATREMTVTPPGDPDAPATPPGPDQSRSAR
jgi:predicted transcriptional regulator